MPDQPSERCRQLADRAMGPCPVADCGHDWTDHRRFPRFGDRAQYGAVALAPGVPRGRSWYVLGPVITDPNWTPESVSCWRCDRVCFPSSDAMVSAWLPPSMDALEQAHAALEREGAVL